MLGTAAHASDIGVEVEAPTLYTGENVMVSLADKDGRMILAPHVNMQGKLRDQEYCCLICYRL
jgi:hypothetical protein